MIGKYLGVLLPTVFGFYGLTGLYGDYTQSLAVKYVGQIAIVLYPPFVMFAVFHNRYIQKLEGSLLKRLKTSPYQMTQPTKEQVIPNDR